MGARSVSGDRDTPMLLPPDLRDWVPKDDLGHFVAMRNKLPTEEGKALYGRRNHPVEPVFDIIKAAMGFRGFRLRGKENLSGNWTLGCLPYNPNRLPGMMESATNGAGDPKSRSTGRNSTPGKAGREGPARQGAGRQIDSGQAGLRVPSQTGSPGRVTGVA